MRAFTIIMQGGEFPFIKSDEGRESLVGVFRRKQNGIVLNNAQNVKDVLCH